MSQVININVEASSVDKPHLKEDPSIEFAIAEIFKNQEASAMASPLAARVTQEGVVRDPLLIQHDAECWKCIGYQESKGGGKIYEFRLKDKYWLRDGVDEAVVNVHKKRAHEDVFPAVEWVNVEPSFDLEELMNQLPQFGYKYKKDSTGVYISLPDKEALEVLFDQHIRSRHPYRKPLKIKDSEGIASDIDFAKAYFSGFDVLLSSGKEFVHDHIAHVIPTIEGITGNHYYHHDARERLEGQVKKVYDKIVRVEEAMKKGQAILLPKELEKVKASLGVWVDGLWSIGNTHLLIILAGKYEYDRFFVTLKSPLFRDFWARRFDGEKFSMDEHEKLWQKVEGA